MAVTINGTSGITLNDSSTVPATSTRSTVQVYSGNGQGSTNTAIRRFSITTTNVGSDITYADSATLGATFTINTNAVYSISYSDSFNGAGSLGISLNSTQLSTSISSITAANRMAFCQTNGANDVKLVATTLYLPSGSVIRAHSLAGTANGASPEFSIFTITRVQ